MFRWIAHRCMAEGERRPAAWRRCCALRLDCRSLEGVRVRKGGQAAIALPRRFRTSSWHSLAAHSARRREKCPRHGGPDADSLSRCKDSAGPHRCSSPIVRLSCRLLGCSGAESTLVRRELRSDRWARQDFVLLTGSRARSSKYMMRYQSTMRFTAAAGRDYAARRKWKAR